MACSPMRDGGRGRPLNSVVRLHPATMSHTCPKCSAPVTYQPTTSQFFAAWFLGDLSGAILMVLIVVAFALVGSDQSDAARVLGGVAGLVIFFKLSGRGARRERDRRVSPLSDCRYPSQAARADAGTVRLPHAD